MSTATVAANTVYEAALQGGRLYANPLTDISVEVTFTSPQGLRRRVPAFWDGGGTWRVRFRPGQPGLWTWRSGCTPAGDQGLEGQAGSFTCVPYEGDNPLYRHGAVGLAASRRHLAHRDGTPFFWLADTAWNGALRAGAADWKQYVRLRASQRFTALQFVTTQWRAEATARAFTRADGQLRVEPGHYQRLDRRLQAVNEQGLLGAPVLLWALTEADPGRYLPEEEALVLCRYLVARWHAHHVAWLLGGDGHYQGEQAARWQRLGRAVFGGRQDRRWPAPLVTMHPCGQSWVTEEFRQEPWFGFHGYQSGHGDSDEHLRWLQQGPPGPTWQTAPIHPVINLEPNYETHPSYHSGACFTDYHVRRAAYWSLLLFPPAGVTYGNNSIWWWGEEPGLPLDHEAIGVVEPWRSGLRLPGVACMTILRGIFDGFAWTELLPAPHLLLSQPGEENPEAFIAVAAAPGLTVAYLPCGGQVELAAEAVPAGARAQWHDPRDGSTQEIAAPFGTRLHAPDGRDWLLVVHGAR